jgi:hypothetical protein
VLYVTCSICKREIDVTVEEYLALPMVEQWPNQIVYLHPGQCATEFEAEQQRKATQSPDNDSPQLRLL